jgi:ribonuclease BN (tRNA processing enzyme)
MEAFRRDSPVFQEFRRRHHTSSVELAAIASAVKPGLLVLYHRGNRAGGPVTREMDDILLAEIRQTYRGEVVAAHDLDVF